MQKTKRVQNRFLAGAAGLLLGLALLMPQTVLAAEGEQPDPTSGETNASVIFTKGDINLVSVPNLDFGTHKNTLTDTTFASKSDAVMKVSDARGSGEGWTLKVDLSEFKLAGETTLEGSEIQVSNPVVNAVDGTLNQNPPTVPVDPDSNLLTVAAGGGDTKVFVAQAHNGRGVWEATWGADNTNLVIRPGTSDVGSNGEASVATMQWSLEQAP